MTIAERASARLLVTGPFDAHSLLGFLARRALPGVEKVHDSTYARTLRLPHGPATVRLTVAEEGVEASFRLSDGRDLAPGVELSRRLLDLDVDSVTVDAHLVRDVHLASSVRANPGLRVPGHVDGFEVAVRAIVGQQISVAGARTVLARLVGDYGADLRADDDLTRLFPRPEDLAVADPDRLPMPRARGHALTALARAVASGQIALDRTRDRAEVRRSLLALTGIGPWTADYIALRALGDPDVFLAGDLGVRHGLARMGLTGAERRVFDAWSPWRSYALMHVWKSLDQEEP